MERVYLDWNATAPVWPEAIDAVARSMRESWGNASSIHEEGRKAAGEAEPARSALADWTGSRALEWVLTSGGTESIHAAVHCVVAARPGKRRIVSSQGEHSCTLGILSDLESQGYEVIRVGLGTDGAWDPSEVLAAADPASTALVTLIWANNETGVVATVRDLALKLKECRIPLHLDAVQCFGRIPIDLSTIPAGLVSLSGHKFGAPKGIGGLFVRQGTPWKRWMQGGNQERGRRGGTVNASGAAGLAAAIEKSRTVDLERIRRGRERLEELVLATIGNCRVVGASGERLPNTTCLCIPGCDSSTLLDRLDARGYAVASGSACTTGVAEPSHVLLAMGMAPEDAHATIRVSTGPTTDFDEVARFAEVLAAEAASVRARAVSNL